MNSIVLDTNALLRFLLNDISSQSEQVSKKIEQAKRGKIDLLIPSIVLFEIAYALTKQYEFSKEKVISGLKKFITSKYLIFEEEDTFREALELYSTANVSLADCFIAVYAKERNATVFTFDKKLKKALERLA